MLDWLRRRLAVAAVLSIPLPLSAAALPAEPAPRIYMTPNYGLLMKVPAGYFHCPLPDGWIGTDHGTNLFFTRPAQCDAASGPHIAIDYEHNVAEIVRADGTEGPPRTALEFARLECRGGAILLTGLHLLGAPAAACRGRDGAIQSFAAVYDLGPRPADEDAPAYTLSVSLVTTPARRAGDERALLRLIRGISVCTPDWAVAFHGRAACPAGARWW